MKNSQSMIPVTALCLTLTGFLIASCFSYRSGTEGAAYYQPPSRPALSSQQRENLTEADIKELIKRGDAEYAAGRYSAAKDIYYEVLLATPNPGVDVLISYGACLAKLQAYENAIDIFNVALEKDPGNATAKGNIAVCRQRLAEQSEAQRKLTLQQQQQQQENFNNLIANLNSASEFAGQVQNNRGGGGGGGQASQGGSGAYSGNSDQDSSSKSSSSGGKDSNVNAGSLQRSYDSRAKAAEDIYFQLQRAKNDKDTSKSTIDRLSDSLKSHQRDLKAYREDCKKKGVDIRASQYETKWP